MSEQKKPEDNPLNSGQWLSWLVMLFALYYLFSVLSAESPRSLSYSEFLARIESGDIKRVQMQGHQIKGYSDRNPKDAKPGSSQFRAVIPVVEDRRLLQQLLEKDIEVQVLAAEAPGWMKLLAGFIPWLLIFALLVYSARAMQGRLGGRLDFTRGTLKSKARRHDSDPDGPGFDQVAGLELAKRDLQEVIEYLRQPQKFQRLGAHMPRGMLMMGPPGTGKTLLARAAANEAGVPFFSISGSEFIELFVGVGAARVREMFSEARASAPSLIFIDEIDSVGRARGTGLGGGHDEREQTLNQILAEMDGFDAHEAVVVLAATNRPDVLDAALLRPGRFDRKVVLELPERPARLKILEVHTRKTPLAGDIDLEQVAALTTGFSGADLANLVNEAALRAARYDREQLTMEDFISARDKVMLGERRDGILTESERRRVAVHEAGHALVAYFSEHSDPVQKVSIIPRGRAMGVTEQRPEQDRHSAESPYLHDRLRILMAGRCAEHLVFNDISSGPADDLKQATRLARQMVGQWGMSRDLGPASFNVAEEHAFLGRELAQTREFSEATADRMDREVIAILQQAEQESTAVLEQHRSQLDRLVSELLQRESLDRDQLENLLTGSDSDD
ncbi:ATP-dependent zinc metalloprotease FtsH [Pseudomaricurvus alkylphenolicus]|uniref:ATP-dependent zinc metalloprotease FtsH n=1 Tax=Pseudomaricurvus alkylphenolicus TaxID=1306991 RepID=UPI00141F162A|nr:ATP-dependent zinc metalloprotease FtsH [Pseudomaricurvus alkylphenolicus]NIB39108.1 ATP-dependent zinc metalloprotease FtsH [Pseudomaricurvus alkylphenolicus]